MADVLKHTLSVDCGHLSIKLTTNFGLKHSAGVLKHTPRVDCGHLLVKLNYPKFPVRCTKTHTPCGLRSSDSQIKLANLKQISQFSQDNFGRRTKTHITCGLRSSVNQSNSYNILVSKHSAGVLKHTLRVDCGHLLVKLTTKF